MKVVPKSTNVIQLRAVGWREEIMPGKNMYNYRLMWNQTICERFHDFVRPRKQPVVAWQFNLRYNSEQKLKNFWREADHVGAFWPR